ncbi:MAG TPA: endonuclease/exonuclease/phosphatase family protein [Micromonosporaceae bacterium]
MLIDEQVPEELTVRAPRHRLLTAVLALATLGLVGLLVCRVAGIDSATPVAQLISFLPYAVPAGVLLALLAGFLRRRRTALAALLASAVLTVLLVPRMVGGDAPVVPDGVLLRVMTVNLWHGDATAELMALLRAERPDLLSVQEVTPQAATRLERAGITDLLPHAAVRPAPGVAGTALYGRAGFTDARTLHQSSRFDMVRAWYVHKGVALDVVATHPSPPIPGPGGAVAAWHRDLGRLPRAAPDDGVVSLLAGDFNATLDHAALRRLIDSGYVDAADAVGDGLTPTWQWSVIPPVTIDHVLVEEGIGIRAVRVHDVGRSDHQAVVADLVVPG